MRPILVSSLLGAPWIASALSPARWCCPHPSWRSSGSRLQPRRPLGEPSSSSKPLVVRIAASSAAADVSAASPSSSSLDEASGLLGGEDEEEEHSGNATSFSLAKWKKKRYLLLRDAAGLVDRGDYDKAARKAREAVRRTLSLYEQTSRPECLRSVVPLYNVWIHALAKRSRAGTNDKSKGARNTAGREAEAVLRELQRQGAELSLSLPPSSPAEAAEVRRRLRPNVITYTSVMDAYASRGQAEDAERILMELLEECDRRPPERDEPGLTSVTVDTVLNAWASRGTPEAAERAEEILARLELLAEEEEEGKKDGGSSAARARAAVRPTARSYAAVLHAWASCGGGAAAARRAHRLLADLVERGRRGPAENAALLDTVVFNAAMHAWASSGDVDAGEKAWEILKQMRELSSSSSSSSSSSATPFFDCRPDIVSYNTVLSAWSHASGHPHAGTRAEKILKEMIVAHRADPANAVAPNTVSYNSVLHAWSRSAVDGAADRAERVLEFMLAARRKQRGGPGKDSDDAASFPAVSPDAYSFTSVLNAIAKSKDPNKATRAQGWLRRLVEERKSAERPGLRLTQVPFNAVINACAFGAARSAPEPDRMRAVEVAVRTLAEMRSEGVDPDEVTYYNMIKCAGNLLSDSLRRRHEMVLPLVESCCRDGMLTESTWNQVCRAVSPQAILDKFLVNPEEQAYASLPRSWKRSVTAAAKRSRGRSNTSFGTAPASRRGQVRRSHSVSESSYESGRDL